MSNDENSNNSDVLRPFEWLTSAASLLPLIQSILSKQQAERRQGAAEDDGARILHVGCGSSVLGELLLLNSAQRQDNGDETTTFTAKIQQIVNVDKDLEVLRFLESRWKQQQCRRRINRNDGTILNDDNDNAMLFVQKDFTCETLEDCCGCDDANNEFDLVIDKSTLDCLLCTDKAAAGLLTEVHRVLKPMTGVYLIISFHDVDFLQPLLANLPGADWEVTFSTMWREIEDLTTTMTTTQTTTISSVASTIHTPNLSSEQETTTTAPPSPLLSAPDTMRSTAAWSNGNFEPDEHYRRTVNVIQCRKQMSISSKQQELHWDAVYQHIHDTNNQWYSQHNPMLTEHRRAQIKAAFENESSSLLDLQQCYQILFSNEEREHLEFEDFLEDWRAFCRLHPDLPVVNQMSHATAVAFLEYAQ